MSDEQFVIITHYQPPGDRRPVVHVWGPLENRSRAITMQHKLRRIDWDQYGDDAAAVRYWVRPIRNPDHHQ